ncbi:MAG: DUF2007 domain-containing protein [Dehalococcoidales bacterium]|jgi:2-methylisocitrate lyase-like PEP mutase family enzyme
MEVKKTVAVYQAWGEMAARVIESLLESQGIPCVVNTGAALSELMGGLGEYQVIVPEELAEAARELIKRDEHA